MGAWGLGARKPAPSGTWSMIERKGGAKAARAALRAGASAAPLRRRRRRCRQRGNGASHDPKQFLHRRRLWLRGSLGDMRMKSALSTTPAPRAWRRGARGGAGTGDAPVQLRRRPTSSSTVLNPTLDKTTWRR